MYTGGTKAGARCFRQIHNIVGSDRQRPGPGGATLIVRRRPSLPARYSRLRLVLLGLQDGPLLYQTLWGGVHAGADLQTGAGWCAQKRHVHMHDSLPTCQLAHIVVGSSTYIRRACTGLCRLHKVATPAANSCYKLLANPLLPQATSGYPLRLAPAEGSFQLHSSVQH